MTPQERAEVDVVVIGSGIGGLGAARMLAEFGGKRVLILEQHYTLGGMTHEFSREQRYRFGTGLHYMGSESGPFLDYVTDGRAQFHPLPDEYDVLHFPGFDFAFPASGARLRARLKERFPAEADAVDHYFEVVRKATHGLAARDVVASFPRIVRLLSFPVIERLYPQAYRTVREQVARSFRDPALRAVIAARSGLYGLPPGRSAFGFHALIPFTYYVEGATHPVGGPRELGQLVIEGLKNHGVDLRPRQRVHRIIVRNGRAVGVEAQDGVTGQHYQVMAAHVVSAVGVRNTQALLDPAPPRRWARQLARLPKEPSALLLFLGLDRSPASFGVRGENHWFMPDLDDDAAFARPPGEGTLYVSFSSLNNPAARSHTVEVLQFIDPEVFAEWAGTDEGGRPDSYRAFKAEITRRVIDRLDQHWPGFAASVALSELATPLSFQTYQNSVQGALYGLTSAPERLRSPVASCRTPVKGLFVAGQDAWGPGIGAALAGGIMAAQAILRPAQMRTMWQALRSTGPARDPAAPWRGYLRVAGTEDLTPSVKRIRLEPLGGGDLPFTFAGGQYVKVDLPVDGDMVERSYSISSGPGTRGYLDLTVKREPHGLGSTFLHDAVQPGQALRLSAPFGEFTGDFAAGSLLLIAGGVGITPIMSVLAEAADRSYPGRIVLLASFRSAADVLFADEINAFKARLPGLEASIFVTRPDGAAPAPGGRIGTDTLRPYAADAARVHLCGPAPMMQALIGSLAELKVSRDAIRTEAFVSSRTEQTRLEKGRAIARAAAAAGIARYTIGVHGGAAFGCPPGQTVLAAAEAAGVPFRHSCFEGACGTCRVRVRSGTFETDGGAQFSAEEVSAGWVLACQTLPTGDLEVDPG